jgi:hypothetical protein
VDKVIADLLPEEVAINNWLIYLLFLNLLRGIVPFRNEAQVFLNATCSIEWCDFRGEVGLEEKRDAGIRSRASCED